MINVRFNNGVRLCYIFVAEVTTLMLTRWELIDFASLYAPGIVHVLTQRILVIIVNLRTMGFDNKGDIIFDPSINPFVLRVSGVLVGFPSSVPILDFIFYIFWKGVVLFIFKG